MFRMSDQASLFSPPRQGEWDAPREVHRIYFDGACAPVNPGGVATFGWRLVAPSGRLIAVDRGEVCRGPGATNNVADWHALWRALRFLAEQGWRGRLQIHGDSQLVEDQLTGRWGCHKEHLRRCRDSCLALLEPCRPDRAWINWRSGRYSMINTVAVR
jgi:ribonuclease HI